MKILTMLSVIIFSATLAWSSERSETPSIALEELPQEVRSEVERALQDAHKARVAYLEALAKANASAVQRLERQVTTQTRRGDLEGALAAKNAIEAINAGWVKSEVEAETDLLGNRVVTSEMRAAIAMNKSWAWGNRVINISPSGLNVSGSHREVVERNKTSIIFIEGSFRFELKIDPEKNIGTLTKFSIEEDGSRNDHITIPISIVE